MTVNAITDTKKGRTGIAPTYLHTTQTYVTFLIAVYLQRCMSSKRKTTPDFRLGQCRLLTSSTLMKTFIRHIGRKHREIEYKKCYDARPGIWLMSPSL